MLSFKTSSFTGVIIIPDDYAMIQTGINMASAGDTVKVRYGTYYETLLVNKDITLTNYYTQKPIITYFSGSTITIASAGPVVSGFDIQTTAQYGNGILVYGNHTAIIDNCIISGMYKGINSEQIQIEIYNCQIFDNNIGVFITTDVEESDSAHGDDF